MINNVLTNNGFSFITIMQILAAIFKTFRLNALKICRSQFLYLSRQCKTFDVFIYDDRVTDGG